MTLRLTINGETRRLALDPATPLLDALRHDLNLTGAKYGCGLEQCGACKALVDGVDLPSCRLPLSQVAGAQIMTVEGLEGDKTFRRLRDAFVAESAAQCGYCTAGMIIAAKALLDRLPMPSDADIRQTLNPNLCRCGIYDRIRRAIRRASGNPDPSPAFETIAAEPLQEAPPPQSSPSLQANPKLDAWLRFNKDETITLFSGKVELGQGIKTALAQIAADELDVAVERIEVVCGDTAQSPDEGGTTGSRSLETSGAAVRAAAANARRLLLSLAFEDLRSMTPAAEIEVRDGVVRDPITRRQTTYWQLMGGRRFGLEVDESAPIKTAAKRQLVGRPHPRSDVAAKASGAPAFVHDMRLPNLLHARVLRPPAYHAELRSLDLDKIRRLPGVIKVVRDGGFVAVVAERADQADHARDEAATLADWHWRDSLLDEADMFADLQGKPAQTHAIVDGVASDVSDAEPRLDEAALTLSATYQKPYHMHGSLGPSAALALWDDARLTVWSHTQAPFVLRAALAQVLHLDASAVRVIHAEGAGCYGHNGTDDVALDAALAARALPGKPILLSWSRADEHAWEPYGSAMRIQLGAQLSPAGQILDWQADIWSYAHSTRPAAGQRTSGLLAAWGLEKPFARQQPGPMLGAHSGAHRNADPIYNLPSKRILRHGVRESPLRVSALRSLGAFANVFAIESFMDELAAQSDMDPLDFRLRHLKDERAREVLLAAAEKADWRQRSCQADTGWGMALAQYKNAQCYAAVIVKLRVDRATGAVRLLHAIIAADAGQIVNPAGLSSQLEGGFVQAASWTLYERVRFDARGITSLDWESYPILRFDNAPVIETVLLDRPDYPMLGAGEATSGPAPAAIANAIFDAIGYRPRDIPFTPDKILRAQRHISRT